MSKNDIREQLGKECAVAGSISFEMNQLRKIQNAGGDQDLETLTITCTNIFTLICCE